MSKNTRASLKEQLDKLSRHLEEENPQLLDVIRIFRRLDQVGYKLHLLDRTESYATQISWWPLVAVLGTYSSGKSTFINSLAGQRLQATGNQAVDDKFTVICYGSQPEPKVLPGLALDSDPRFPFFKISRDIDEELAGEGQRLDSYLQLKTCNSEYLRGKIIIDSPGFDADAQRTSTLRITNHIIDLSDLVLVFFDARHPEPGAMGDTLAYLVERPLERPDFTKFMYILNQIDNAAREDNPEEVFAAWQRALGQKGLTAGRFYRIYDKQAAPPIADEQLRTRFETKRDEDMKAITDRIDELDVVRSYRVAGRLEQTAKQIRDRVVPALMEARSAWRRRVWWYDGLAFGAAALVFIAWGAALGYWEGLSFNAPWVESVTGNPWLLGALIVIVAVLALQLHWLMRRVAGKSILKRLQRDDSLGEWQERIVAAFRANVESWRPFFLRRPVGWGMMTSRRLGSVLSDVDKVIQDLNDHYTDPSGKRAPAEQITPLPAAEDSEGEEEPSAGFAQGSSRSSS